MQIELTQSEAAALAKLLRWSDTDGWIYNSRPNRRIWDAIRAQLGPGGGKASDPTNCRKCARMAYSSLSTIQCLTPNGDHYDMRMIAEVKPLDWRRRIAPPDWCPRKQEAAK